MPSLGQVFYCVTVAKKMTFVFISFLLMQQDWIFTDTFSWGLQYDYKLVGFIRFYGSGNNTEILARGKFILLLVKLLYRSF